MEKEIEKWKMPEWMEPYRDSFYSTGGNSIEDLMDAPNRNPNLSKTNIIMFTLAMMAEAQVAILTRLHKDGKLTATDREKRLVEALGHSRATTRITYAKDQVWIDFYADRSTAILHYRERKGDWLHDNTEDSDWEGSRKWKKFKSIEEAFAFLKTKSAVLNTKEKMGLAQIKAQLEDAATSSDQFHVVGIPIMGTQRRKMNNEQQAARDAAINKFDEQWAFSDDEYPFKEFIGRVYDAGYAARDAEDAWVAERPDYACVFVGKRTYRGKPEYSVWQFVWTQGEGGDFDEEDAAETDSTIYYCLTWTDHCGDEWDDMDECNFDEYLVLAKLPTMDEVHAETIQRMKARFEREMQPAEGD